MQMQVPRFARSLVVRLVLIGLLLVISGASMRYFMLTAWLRQDVEALVSAERLAIATVVARDIDQKLLERRTLLARVADTLPLPLLDQPTALQAWLAERQPLLPPFSLGLVVVDRGGVALAASPPAPERIERRYGGEAAYQEAMRGRFALSRPAVDAVSTQPALPMATPVRDASGSVRAVLLGIAPMSAFDLHDAPQQDRPDASGGLLLVSPQDRLFVSSTDPSMVFQPVPPPGINSLHDRAMAGYRGTGITTNANGVEELSAIVSVPQAGWFVVARIPTELAFAAIVRIKTYVLRSSLISVVLAFLLIAGLTGWALKPLFGAARQADAMTRGEAPLQPLRVFRDDEVGHLTAAFNRLLQKLSSSQDELSHMAHHDSLTGLPNRRLLADRLLQALARSRRSGTRIALLVMDLDGFKPLNDLHGHEAGDKALRMTAERFASAVRQNDTLARVGGDEFVLLAPDLAGTPDEVMKAAQAIASKCISIASQPLVIEGARTGVGVSIGIALCDGECRPDDLLNAADQAMYEAKQGGRGRYVVSTAYSPSVPERAASAAA
jgi:diguanylate cyclase (GGDEF)-like protein